MTKIFSNVLDYLAINSQTLNWVVWRVLTSVMFMTHGYSKLFSDDPQALTGSGMTSIEITGIISWSIPFEVNALFIAGIIEFFGGALICLGLWTRGGCCHLCTANDLRLSHSSSRSVSNFERRGASRDVRCSIFSAFFFWPGKV